MRCPNCGAEVGAEDVFCGECGAQLPRKRGRSGVPVVIGVVVAVLIMGLVCAGGLAVVFWPRPTPTPGVVTELSPTPIATPSGTVVPVPTVTVPVGLSFTDVFFAAGATDDGQATDRAYRFPAGTTIVYAFATYEGTSDGTPCESVFYLDGEEHTRHSFEWAMGESGQGWIVNIYNDEGLAIGSYDWELYVEGQLVVTGSFAVEEQAAVLFEEDFSDPGSGWEVGDYNAGSVGYIDGIYSVISLGDSNRMWGLAYRSFQDVIIEVDATQVSAGPDDNNAYGVMCRVQPNDDGYAFSVSGDGFCSIYRLEDGVPEALVDWSTSSAILQGNATNHIRVVCDGSDLALFVNGDLLVEVSDFTFSEGDIALTATSFEEEPTEVHFDNLLVFAAPPQ